MSLILETSSEWSGAHSIRSEQELRQRKNIADFYFLFNTHSGAYAEYNVRQNCL